MNEPNYPAFSAKMLAESQALCRRCGLSLLGEGDVPDACPSSCPALILKKNAQAILHNHNKQPVTRRSA